MTKVVFGDDAILCGDTADSFRCGHTPTMPREEHGGIFTGSKCRTGCKTKDHASYADCLADASIGTFLVKASMGQDGTEQKRWDRELDSYHRARKEGMQPDGTTQKKIDEARRLSDKAGAGYGKDFSKAAPMESA